MPLEYTQFNWPKRDILIFPLPQITESTVPYYFTGSSSGLAIPDSSRSFFIRRMVFSAVLSAVGTGVQLTAQVYNGAIDSANSAMAVSSTTTNNPGNISRQNATALNTATGKDFFSSSSGFIGEISLAAGDTFVLDAGGIVVVEVEFV